MLVKTFRLSEHEVAQILVDTDRAAVHWSATVHSRITGKQVSTEFVALIGYRDRQVVRYQEFFVPRSCELDRAKT
jgi:ketosteroid isomerase-like protein